MRPRSLLPVWVLVTAGWCWRWAYVRWPEMRLAFFWGGFGLVLGAAHLLERWRARPARAQLERPGLMSTEMAAGYEPPSMVLRPPDGPGVEAP